MTQENGYEGSYDDTKGDYDEGDIFAAAPKAINWGEEFTKGDDFDFLILGTPELVQGWDADKKRPAVWEDSGNPKMNAVIRIEWHGEERSLWATKPSALYRMIQEASRAARVSIRPGGHLLGKYDGLGKKERGMRSAPHQYKDVTYIPES